MPELSVLSALVVGINPKNKKLQLVSLQEEETNTKKKVTRLSGFHESGRDEWQDPGPKSAFNCKNDMNG